MDETKSMYFEDAHKMDFEGKVVDVFANVMKQNRSNLLIID